MSTVMYNDRHACIYTCTMYNVCVYDPLSVNCRIVCNQLPPELMEKVQLVGGEGIEVRINGAYSAPDTR